jgi:photosystem II stability/assembly factor-like uncharacterized protein
MHRVWARPLLTQTRSDLGCCILFLHSSIRFRGVPIVIKLRSLRCAALLLSAFIFLLMAWSLDAQQVDPSLYSGMQWRLIGPFRGGRALAAVGVPGQPNLFYFGAVGGGVWKSTDAGTVWEPVFDSQPIASIGAIAVAPSNPNVIYVGSGEADMRSAITYGNGMYKSTDAGATWNHIGLTDSRQIGRIIVDPKNPDVAFVAALGHAYGPNAERGVFRTRDGGKTWQKVLYKDADTGAIDLAFEPGNPQVIYASLWQTRRPPWNVYPPSNGPGSGLYKSTDGGNTWLPVAGLPTEGLGKIGIAVAPSMPNRVYLVLDAKQGGVFRSDDAGKTWEHVSSEQRVWGRGWYFCGVTVDPKNPDTIYVANTSVYRSTDGGKNFTAIKGAPGGDDYHSVWIASEDSQRWIVASDQGTIVTLNGGKTWSSWYNQPTGQFYHAITDSRFPYWVYGAQQDSGAYGVPSRSIFAGINEHDWRPIAAGGESGSIAPDPLDPNILFGGTVGRFDLTTGEDQDIAPSLTRPGSFRRTWTLPLAFSPKDPHKLYFSHQQLFRTTDGGKTWDTISPDLTREDPGVPPNLDPITAKDGVTGPRRGVIYAIAPSPLDAQLVWVGTDDGLIHVTHDDGAHWANVTPPDLTAWSKVGIIEASHFDRNTAYAAIDRHRLEDYRAHIYRTHDGGKSWQHIDAGIPEGAFVNVVREDPVRVGLLYAGTELGVYCSFDDGQHWQPLQLNLPAVSVRDIVVHQDDLVIATHGRAFWILDNVTPLRQTAAVADQPAYLFKPQTALRIRPGSDEGTPLPPEIAKAPNAPSGAMIDYYLKQDNSSPVALDIFDAAGKLVRHYASDEAAPAVDPKTLDIPMYWIHPAQPPSATRGMHRFLWDMHYAAPAQGAAAPRRRFGSDGPWAAPGEYRVQLTVAGQQYSQPLTLKPDPRTKATVADLVQQFEVASHSAEMTASSGRVLRQSDALKKAAADLKPKATDAATRQQLDDFVQKLTDIAGATVAGAFGAPAVSENDQTSFRYLNRAFTQLEAAVESADVAPTPEVVRAVAANAQKLDQVNAKWKALMETDMPRLNERLRQAGLEPLNPDARPSTRE